MTIGDKILNMRKARGWSQEELADRVGVTRQAVSRWESGSAKPEADKIVDICDLFGVSADYLLRDKYAGEGVTNAPSEHDPASRRGTNVTAVQILGILLILSSVLTFCALGIVSAVKPHCHYVNGVSWGGIIGYIMGNRLWWFVTFDVCLLAIGIVLLTGKTLRQLATIARDWLKTHRTRPDFLLFAIFGSITLVILLVIMVSFRIY